MEVVGSLVVLLVQVRAPSTAELGGDPRWCACSLRSLGSLDLLGAPSPSQVPRNGGSGFTFEADDVEGRRCCSWSWVEAPRSSRSGDFPSARGRLLLQGLKEDAAAARHRHVLLHAGDIELQKDWIVISFFVGCLSVLSDL